jgi:regulator of protease activity HflC (stomatin/prohibitin superfamily)
MEWLNKLFDLIINLFPNLCLLEPNDGGLKFKPRDRTVELASGRLYVYWPVTTQVYTIPIVRQTLTFSQTLTTLDDITVHVSTIVIYTINDVVKAIKETDDLNETIGDSAQYGAVKAITSRNYNDIRNNPQVNLDITRSTRKFLRKFGVKVEDAFISSFAETKMMTHEGSGFVINDD